MTIQQDLREFANSHFPEPALLECQAADHIDKIEGEAKVMRSILSEADQVLSSIEPADEHEAALLGELRRKVKAVLYPDADFSLF